MVTIEKVAIGSASGTAMLYRAQADAMSRLGEPNKLLRDRVEPIEVPVTTIDEFCVCTGLIQTGFSSTLSVLSLRRSLVLSVCLNSSARSSAWLWRCIRTSGNRPRLLAPTRCAFFRRWGYALYHLPDNKTHWENTDWFICHGSEMLVTISWQARAIASRRDDGCGAIQPPNSYIAIL